MSLERTASMDVRDFVHQPHAYPGFLRVIHSMQKPSAKESNWKLDQWLCVNCLKLFVKAAIQTWLKQYITNGKNNISMATFKSSTHTILPSGNFRDRNVKSLKIFECNNKGGAVCKFIGCSCVESVLLAIGENKGENEGTINLKTPKTTPMCVFNVLQRGIEDGLTSLLQQTTKPAASKEVAIAEVDWRSTCHDCGHGSQTSLRNRLDFHCS